MASGDSEKSVNPPFSRVSDNWALAMFCEANLVSAAALRLVSHASASLTKAWSRKSRVSCACVASEASSRNPTIPHRHAWSPDGSPRSVDGVLGQVACGVAMWLVGRMV